MGKDSCPANKTTTRTIADNATEICKHGPQRFAIQHLTSLDHAAHCNTRHHLHTFFARIPCWQVKISTFRTWTATECVQTALEAQDGQRNRSILPTATQTVGKQMKPGSTIPFFPTYLIVSQLAI